MLDGYNAGKSYRILEGQKHMNVSIKPVGQLQSNVILVAWLNIAVLSSEMCTERGGDLRASLAPFLLAL